MKTTKLITTILLTTFLASCKGPQIKPRVIKDISFQFNRCRLNCFDLMSVKSVDKSRCNITRKLPDSWPDFYSKEYDNEGKPFLKFIPGNYPLHYCDGLLGFDVDDYAVNIRPWAKEARQYYKDRCK